MTRTEFLTKLESELKKNGVADAADVVAEYGEHFAFKLADGYTEEEIAARLGQPAELAAQFEPQPDRAQAAGRRVTTGVGLAFCGLFASVVFTLLWAWELVMGAAALGFAGLAGCLLLGLNYRALIPPVPYWCGALYGLALVALAALAVAGCRWFAAYVRQLMRAYARFHRNAMAAACARPALPPVPAYPRLAPKVKRALRRLALCALSAFAVCFVLGLIVSALSAGSLAFWHAWGWFGGAPN